MCPRKRTSIFIQSLLIFSCIISCGDRKLSKEEILDYYGPEVINYFYETAFHTDRGEGVLDKAHRWENDILISMHGEMMEGDSLSVQKTIKTINDLDLGVSINFADSAMSHIEVYFGDAEYLAKQLNIDSVVTVGMVVTWKESGFWYRGKVAIVNNAPLYNQIDRGSGVRLREATILEEIVQCLGIVGDSYTYYESVFFEGPAKGGEHFNGLTEIDRQTIKFLYDKRVFGNSPISRKKFEERFSEVLYNRLEVGKFLELISEYRLDRSDLDSIGKMIFRSETQYAFVKFPRNAFLKLSGVSSEKYLNFCRELGAKFNITPYLKIDLVRDNRLWNYSPTITVHFDEDDKYKGTIDTQMAVIKQEMMFSYHTIGNVWLRFSNPEKEDMPYDQVMFAQYRALTSALFKILGIAIPDDEALIKVNPDNFEIDEKYMDYFRFLYDPRFPSGINKTEFDKLLISLNRKL